MISLRLTASSEESHHCGCWPLRWLTQTLSITTSLYLAAVFSASYWFRLKTPTNKHSLLLQYDQPALSWVYSAEARYPASPPSPSRPHHGGGGGGGGRTDGRTDWELMKTVWTPAWTTCLATGLPPQHHHTCLVIRTLAELSSHASAVCKMQNLPEDCMKWTS